MTISRSIQLVLIVALSLGCSTSKSSFQKQANFIDDIHSGQDIGEFYRSIGHIVENSFEVLEDGKIYQYMQTRHPNTGVLIGLYFEGNRLAGKIVRDDVTTFHIYRASKPDDDHWLAGSFSKYRFWIMERNKLRGTPLDYSQSGDEQRKSEIVKWKMQRTKKRPVISHDTAEEVAHMIWLAPLTLIAAPFMALDKIKNVQKRDEQKERNQYEILNSLHLGMPEESLVNLMGQIGRRIHIKRTGIYTYLVPTYSSLFKYRPSFSFGVKNGKVIWMESCSMLTGSKAPRYNDSKSRIRTDCGSVEGPSQRGTSSESTLNESVCQISQAARNAIDLAVNLERKTSQIQDLITQAEEAAKPPECDSVRAKILADKAYQMMIESNQ